MKISEKQFGTLLMSILVIIFAIMIALSVVWVGQYYNDIFVDPTIEFDRVCMEHGFNEHTDNKRLNDKYLKLECDGVVLDNQFEYIINTDCEYSLNKWGAHEEHSCKTSLDILANQNE